MDKFVHRLRDVRKKKAALDEELACMCKPVLDISYAAWVKRRIPDNDVFLMVALRLFTPRTLAGKRMECGNVRDEICKQMGINKWSVSKRIQLVLFYYDNTKRFKGRVNNALKSVLEELGRNGIVEDYEKYL